MQKVIWWWVYCGLPGLFAIAERLLAVCLGWPGVSKGFVSVADFVLTAIFTPFAYAISFYPPILSWLVFLSLHFREKAIAQDRLARVKIWQRIVFLLTVALVLSTLSYAATWSLQESISRFVMIALPAGVWALSVRRSKG